MDNEAMEALQKRVIELESYVNALNALVEKLMQRVEELEGEVDSNGPFTI
jgi:prefoldin subunit 5